MFVGIDGCQNGWVAAALRQGSVLFSLHPSFAEAMECYAEALRIAVDIPLGLADGTGRRCDVLARKALGRKASSIFPAPARELVYTAREQKLTYSAANQLSRATYQTGLSAQQFNLFRKVHEANLWLEAQPHQAARVFESHPELAFAMLNTGAPVPLPKKTTEGYMARHLLLQRFMGGLPTDQREARMSEPFGEVLVVSQPDDTLDAAVCAWVAQECGLEGDWERNRQGLPMRIVVPPVHWK